MANTAPAPAPARPGRSKKLAAEIEAARAAKVPATEYDEAWVSRDPTASPEIVHPDGDHANHLLYTPEAGWADPEDYYSLRRWLE